MSLQAVASEPRVSIKAKPLALFLGAEISGVDLSKPVDDATFAAIHDALMQHQVIFFRDQQLTQENQLALASRFGPPTYSKKLPKYEGHDYTSLIQTDGSTINVGGKWHTDNTDFAAPPMGAVLYCEQTPSFGGDTLFKGGPGATGRSYSSFETIIESIRERLLVLPPDTVVHTGHGDRTTIGEEAPHLDEWIARGH